MGFPQARKELAFRLKQIRVHLYGPQGATVLAGELNLPPRTWMSYEAGVAMPSETLLQFIACTDANPRWLLTGDGEPYLLASRAILDERRVLSLVPSEN